MPRRIVMVAISIHGVCEVVGLEIDHYQKNNLTCLQKNSENRGDYKEFAIRTA